MINLLLAPPVCETCEREVASPPSFCKQCEGTLVKLPQDHCSLCGVPFSSNGSGPHRCGNCLRHRPPFEKVWAAYTYEGILSQVIHQAKFGKRPAGLDLLAQRSAFLLTHVLKEFPADVMVPIPLNWRRQFRRGYNQSVLLAIYWRRWAKKKIPVLTSGIRRSFTGPLAKQDRKARRKALQEVFDVRQARKFAGKKILLIDDVMTTGATVEALTRCLLEAGAKAIQVLVLARVGN